MMRKLLDGIPLVLLGPLALFLAVAPVKPVPHLWQKLTMLADGTLTRPIDIFDLFLHGVPLLLVIVKLILLALPATPGGGDRQS